MRTLTRHFKIVGVPKDFVGLPFGRQIEFLQKIREFKEKAKSVHISQKRRAFSTAFREFKTLYEPVEWYCEVIESPDYRDDSVQIWYTTKEI